MGAASTAQITAMLLRWNQGDEHALDSLLPLVYSDLHRIAAHQLRAERRDHTLQPTALINELYLKIGAEARFQFLDRAHFLAVAARAMRQILVDYARKRKSKKRYALMVPLEDAMVFTPARSDELLMIDQALSALSQQDIGKARVVELKYFGGLTDEEIASVLQSSPRTVSRDWKYAKAWLRRAMNSGEADTKLSPE
jgi:RNA polymerase sigma factor (TIGR02999 family)